MCEIMIKTQHGGKRKKNMKGDNDIFSYNFIKFLSDIIFLPIYEIRNIVIMLDYIEYTTNILCIYSIFLFFYVFKY